MVTSLDDKSGLLQAYGRKGQDITISYQNLKWASPFINDKRQGPTPKKVSDVAKVGDLIFYSLNDKNEAELAQVPEVEASIVALNQYNGAIVAMVGGYDFAKSKLIEPLSQHVRLVLTSSLSYIQQL